MLSLPYNILCCVHSITYFCIFRTALVTLLYISPVKRLTPAAREYEGCAAPTCRMTTSAVWIFFVSRLLTPVLGSPAASKSMTGQHTWATIEYNCQALVRHIYKLSPNTNKLMG